MTRISIETAYSPIEVDLWGALFETVDQTKGNQKKMAKCQAKLAVADEGDETAIIRLFGELFDLMFRPIEGGRKKASTQLKEQWDAGNLGIGQIGGFLQKVAVGQRKTLEQGLEEVLTNGRPT